MLVSVVMPVYNCEQYLQSSIESVRAQTHGGWELLCVDDKSTDGSLDLLYRLSAVEPRIKILKHDRNKGAAAARNSAIEAAKGDYIAFLDADDLWMPDKLKLQLAVAQAEKREFICGAYDVVDTDGQRRFTVRPPESISYNDLLKTSHVGCSTVIVSRNLIAGTRVPDIRKRQDYALWLLLVKKCGTIRGMPETLTQYRLTPGSLSRKKSKVLKYQWLVYREVAKLNLFQSIWYFCHYAFHAVLRRIRPRIN